MKSIIITTLLFAVVNGSEIQTGSCFTPDSDVVVGFNIDNANDRDWIGLFPAGSIGDNAPEPRSRNWIWTCGDQNCGSSPSSGFGRISNPKLSGADKWVAVIARFNKGSNSQKVVAVSKPFRVSSSCDGPAPVKPSPPRPSPSPPNPSPSSNAATVTTSKDQFHFGGPIKVAFMVGSADSRDWIGIFDADKPVAEQRSGHLWLRAGCDRQGTKDGCAARTVGGVTFHGDKMVSWKSDWPLPPGRYVAALVRGGSNRPWPVLDVSPPFEIRILKMSKTLINFVREDITQLIKDDVEMAAKFLRLGFHDSVGGPDGCVDLTNIHNRGLDVPIDALQPIVDKYKGPISRTDIWAMAAMVAPEVTQPKNANFKASFDFTEFGRVNCEKQHSVCRNENGVSHGCSAKRGPHREIPGANTNTHELFTFFRKNFGFNQRQTVAIMGAHTLGVLQRKNSGVNGPNGWVNNKHRFDNEYYHHLIGGKGPDASVRDLVQLAPNWTREFENNQDLPDFDDLHLWHGLPPELKGRFIVMLNADIAIVRDLNESNMNSKTGEVSCQFVDRSGNDPTCPHVDGALQEAARYMFNNKAWLIDFEDVLRRMINTGYVITTNCVDDICKLRRS